MSTPTKRRGTTAVTLAALVVLVAGIGWWGFKELTKPFPGRAASAEETCSAAETTRQEYVRPDDVTVSVYNAGARQGFASITMQRLEARGFSPGTVANAPRGTKVAHAKVFTTETDSAAAELVARTLGPKVPIEVVDEEYGPGVDVFLGAGMRLLNQHAPAKVKLAEPITECVRVD